MKDQELETLAKEIVAQGLDMAPLKHCCDRWRSEVKAAMYIYMANTNDWSSCDSSGRLQDGYKFCPYCGSALPFKQPC